MVLVEGLASSGPSSQADAKSFEAKANRLLDCEEGFRRIASKAVIVPAAAGVEERSVWQIAEVVVVLRGEI